MKKNNKAAMLTMTVIIGIMSICTVFAGDMNASVQQSTENIDIIYPADMEIEPNGSYSGSGFETSYTLNKKNGDTVNFYVENTGNVDIKITINGSGARTISAGKSGHISATVSSISKKYTFKAVPTPNGGSIKMNYRIAQRTNS